MKTIVGLVILAMGVSSCMDYHCHTYDGSKGHASSASARKSKPAKNHTAFYKKSKLAEKD